MPKAKSNPAYASKAAQPAFARKAAALRAAGQPRLLAKPEVMAIAGVTFPTIWTLMRDGKFPRSRIVGGRSMWLSTEVDEWLADLPMRPLKGDKPEHDTAAA